MTPQELKRKWYDEGTLITPPGATLSRYPDPTAEITVVVNPIPAKGETRHRPVTITIKADAITDAQVQAIRAVLRGNNPPV